MTTTTGFIPLRYERDPDAKRMKRLEHFAHTMSARRTVRAFDTEPIDLELIRKAVAIAGTSPSGANQQPWQFVLVTDKTLRHAIYEAAEQESKERLALGLPKLAENADRNYLFDKQALESAPALVVLLRLNYGLASDGTRVKHYYANESTSICAGFFLSALQHAGLACSIHAPVKACETILQRGANESVHLLFTIGIPRATGDLQQIQRLPIASLYVGEQPHLGQVGLSKNAAPAKPLLAEEPHAALDSLYEFMKQRRVIRDFSDEPVDNDWIERSIAIAATAPSGGNLKPWRYSVIRDPDLKRQLRTAAEREEKLLYEERISDEWRQALAPLGTTWEKPHLTIAPQLIACFKVMPHTGEQCDVLDDSVLFKDGLRQESAGIAAGLLIMALHHAGLYTLTHTPNPMQFLRKLLQRPIYEFPFLLLPVGYPAHDCQVPDIHKKPLTEIWAQV